MPTVIYLSPVGSPKIHSNPDQSPQISVITPCYQSVDFLSRALESVRLQEDVRVEHIVVDGGSTDGTVELLKAQNFARWISEPDRGQGHAFNKGLRIASSPLIGWLNADDVYLPHALSRVVDCFADHPQSDLINCGLERVDDLGRCIEYLPAKSSQFWLRHFWFRWYGLNHPSTFYRRTIFELVGEIDSSLHFAMDYDFYLRASRLIDFLDADFTTTQMLVHGGSKTSQGWSPFAHDVRASLKKVWAAEHPWFYRYSMSGTAMHEARHHLVESFIALRAGNLESARVHRELAGNVCSFLRLTPGFYSWFLRVLLWRVLGEKRYSRWLSRPAARSDPDD